MLLELLEYISRSADNAEWLSGWLIRSSSDVKCCDSPDGKDPGILYLHLCLRLLRNGYWYCHYSQSHSAVSSFEPHSGLSFDSAFDYTLVKMGKTSHLGAYDYLGINSFTGQSHSYMSAWKLWCSGYRRLRSQGIDMYGHNAGLTVLSCKSEGFVA